MVRAKSKQVEKMNKTIIRKMELTDLDDVMNVELASFQSPWKREDFEFDLVKNRFSHYLVLEKDERVIAYCGVWIVMESAQITNIAVLPEERGHKYGEKLFVQVMKMTKRFDVDELTLEVRESNKVAQKMYEKFGLEIVGRRENYYPDQEDAYVMWVKLS
ncbi:ribosomal protein S18-alanine N-acetyltransferase [Alkalibacillus haloalkaliphilus]|uniref:ribosomal protein S18-alanine N-acetyltransferase n=1 Tax=Alkalibacillus haloalkaliphilus TaxID=94136 RepID=UPI002936A461|nr:ribosomal protein S18-alanine N-acetyltransferase [Alkalibacillus haloalkaliphilus]MDV2583499.1 ribosomal protein S18-alanine N-acetyltransferase [Alkalibacillus haloalkaliphilus]